MVVRPPFLCIESARPVRAGYGPQGAGVCVPGAQAVHSATARREATLGRTVRRTRASAGLPGRSTLLDSCGSSGIRRWTHRHGAGRIRRHHHGAVHPIHRRILQGRPGGDRSRHARFHDRREQHAGLHPGRPLRPALRCHPGDVPRRPSVGAPGPRSPYARRRLCRLCDGRPRRRDRPGDPDTGGEAGHSAVRLP